MPCSTLLENISERNQFFKIKLFYKMSTTRSQKRRNDQQSTNENVSEGLISPIVIGNPCPLNQDDEVAGPSNSKSPRIENSFLESLRASLKEEITSEIKNLLVESQKELLKLLKPEIRGSIRENTEEEVEEETRNFYTPTKSVRISSTQNDSLACRNRDFAPKVREDGKMTKYKAHVARGFTQTTELDYHETYSQTFLTVNIEDSACLRRETGRQVPANGHKDNIPHCTH